MLTWVRLALVNVEFAALATVTFRAVANKLAHAVLAASTIKAGVGFAFVHVAQASGVKVAARAVTLESVDQIRAFT